MKKKRTLYIPDLTIKHFNSDIRTSVVNVVGFKTVTLVVVEGLVLVVLAVQPQADVLLLADHRQLLQDRHPHTLMKHVALTLRLINFFFKAFCKIFLIEYFNENKYNVFLGIFAL